MTPNQFVTLTRVDGSPMICNLANILAFYVGKDGKIACKWTRFDVADTKFDLESVAELVRVIEEDTFEPLPIDDRALPYSEHQIKEN